MRVRPEDVTDRSAVRAVNEAAFDSSAEADLVDVLHGGSTEVISLVAERDDVVVGHILFSQVTLTGHRPLNLMGLGPMAVTPQQQRTGVGSALVREGLARCKQHGVAAVVVLGHPDYYPRFGFVPASRFSIRCEYDVPDDVFMIIELKAGALVNASGVILYDKAFASVE